MGSLSIPCLVPLPSGAVSLSGAGTFLMRVIELATNSSSFSLPLPALPGFLAYPAPPAASSSMSQGFSPSLRLCAYITSLQLL